MNFKSPQLVLDTISASDEVERVRGLNRVKINNQLNGAPPLSDAEARANGLKINANFGEAPVLVQHARRQYSNAVMRPGKFFDVKIPTAPTEMQRGYETDITRAINRIMKNSREFYEFNRSKFASVVAHGIGPSMWRGDGWRPNFVAIEDLRIPTGTLLSLENLEWFAVHHSYTEGELAAKITGDNVVPGWNVSFVRNILSQYHKKNFVEDDDGVDWENFPEKAAELVKQNIGYYTGAAVPTIPLWHFYYKEKDGWCMVVIPTRDTKTGEKTTEWVYKTDEKIADSLDQILHIHFGDLSAKAPFMYHSVRSLGFLLMEPCFWTNYFRCRLLQHATENLNPQWRVTDPAGRARAEKIEVFYNSVLPEGVSAVTQQERHQINPQLVNMVMSQLKQLQSEASVSYTQDINDGTKKEQTATETMAKVQSVNAMMSGLLDTAFHYETFLYREIARRFCAKSDDPDIVKFRKAVRHIPPQFINADLWDIEPVVPMGSGNPTMAVAQAQQLLSMLPMFNPIAQEEIKQEVTTVITEDPRKAKRWVPLDKSQEVTSAQRDAESVFGTLMQGVPVHLDMKLNPTQQIQTLLGLLAGVVASISPNTNFAGIQAVGMYVTALIERLKQDPQHAAMAKQFQSDLQELLKEAYAAAENFAQAQAQQQNPDPETQAKIISLQATSDAKLQARQAQDAQKLAQKDIAFAAEESRKDIKTNADIIRASASAETSEE